MTKKPKQSWAIHCPCNIKRLPKEAVKEIPSRYRKVCKAWVEANEARVEAREAWDASEEADKAWEEAYKAWEEADKASEEAYDAWPQKSKDAFHKKWCGCKEWDGEMLIFDL